MPRLLTVIHMWWFKGHGDVREAYTANTYIYTSVSENECIPEQNVC